MSNVRSVLCWVLGAASVMVSSVTWAGGMKITPSQRNYLEREIIAIVHWGINTFSGQEWGNGYPKNIDYLPKTIGETVDPLQWVQAMKAGGIREVIMVSKHHDGFCLWPATNGYSTAILPEDHTFRNYNVPSNVFTACQAEDVDFGVYLSPWDRNHAEWGHENGIYQAYFHSQYKYIFDTFDVSEIWIDRAMGGLSEISWYGGAEEGRTLPCKADDYYDFKTVQAMLNAKRPLAIVFDGHCSNSVVWAGNEDGYAPEDWSYDRNEDGVPYFGAPEVDTPFGGRPDSLAGGGKGEWFWHPGYEPKSLERLIDSYFKSVGRGGVLNLGIAPDQRGELSFSVVKRLGQLGAFVNGFNASDVFAGATVKTETSKTNTTVTLTASEPRAFKVIDFGENLDNGQIVTNWTVEVRGEDGQWGMVALGTRAGWRRMARLASETTADAVRITAWGETTPTLERIHLRQEPKVLIPLHWDGAGESWTNALGVVTNITDDYTLIMKDGDRITFTQDATPGDIELPDAGTVTITGQDHLKIGTLVLPPDCTVEMLSNVAPGMNAVTGTGVLCFNPGTNVEAVAIGGKLTTFTGTYWMKSGRHNYGSPISMAVALKVTDGAQLWLTGGTWKNLFHLSGQGWSNPESVHDIEHAALRLDTAATLDGLAAFVFEKVDGKTAAIGIHNDNYNLGVSMSGDGFEKRGSGTITLTAPATQAADLTGESVVGAGTLTVGTGSGLSAGDTVKIGSGITVNDGATLNVHCWTGGEASANTNKMVTIANDITIKGGGQLQTVDGAYDFSGKVTANDGAKGRFVYRRSWAFTNLVIPTDATFDAVVAGDDSRNVYFSVLGGDVKGTLKVTNEGDDRILHHYELRVALSGTALANGTINFVSPDQKSWIVLVGDASLGNVTGDIDAAFGDGTEASGGTVRNLTLTGGSYGISFKGIDKGTVHKDLLNLVIAGNVTLNHEGTSTTCSGTTTVAAGGRLSQPRTAVLPTGTLVLEKGAALALSGRTNPFAAPSNVVVAAGATIPVTLADETGLAAGDTLMTWATGPQPEGDFELRTSTIPYAIGDRPLGLGKTDSALVVVTDGTRTCFEAGAKSPRKLTPFLDQWLKDEGVWDEGSFETTQTNLDTPYENGLTPGYAYLMGYGAKAGEEAAIMADIAMDAGSGVAQLAVEGLPEETRNGAVVTYTVRASLTPDMAESEVVYEGPDASMQIETLGEPQRFFRAAAHIDF